ncbi:unnamed protein product [Hymenolepis diminuta]|uniref:Uncharacterized protein n=1 Tax=Hymenolepis diminuta TaxID=6216 RepID=A0A564Y4T8_HYMDI|nr:unnamed protein product [Hymenolepis diminuta]
METIYEWQTTNESKGNGRKGLSVTPCRTTSEAEARSKRRSAQNFDAIIQHWTNIKQEFEEKEGMIRELNPNKKCFRFLPVIVNGFEIKKMILYANGGVIIFSQIRVRLKCTYKRTTIEAKTFREARNKISQNSKV